jgi:sulfonate transport system ATP-binding protein
MKETEAINIDIKNLKKIYSLGNEDLEVLRDICIHVDAGTSTSIIGQSGCGKSTVLKIIAALEKPSSGQVEFNGKEVTKPSLDVGVLFQESRLLPWYDVEKNVDFGLPRSVKKDERKKLVQEYISLVGLSGFEHALPEQLSGGMKKRVSIARTLINKPHVLLLDEPFGALDAFTKIGLQNELRNICEKTTITTILVTHDIEEAIFLGSQVVIMTPKPGVVKKVIPINIKGKPQRTSEEFSLYRKEIFKEFFDMDDTNIDNYY